MLQDPFADQHVDRGDVDGQRVGRPVDERGGRAHGIRPATDPLCMPGLGSMPVAVPVGPTLAARRTVLAPVPEPTSSATSPGAMASRSNAQSRNRITLGCAAWTSSSMVSRSVWASPPTPISEWRKPPGVAS